MAEHVALLISEPETPVALVLALQLTKEMVARLCERERHSPSSARCQEFNLEPAQASERLRNLSSVPSSGAGRSGQTGHGAAIATIAPGGKGSLKVGSFWTARPAS